MYVFASLSHKCCTDSLALQMDVKLSTAAADARSHSVLTEA